MLRPRLKAGASVAVVSPASAARLELIDAGVERLRGFGYEPQVMPHARCRGPLYFAGTEEERASDLRAAFESSEIEGILCTRGGWGSAELLPKLNRDWACAQAKLFVGYSDHTSLHAWLWNECRMQTGYAPMVAADWSKPDGADERSWRLALESREAWELGPADGLRVLRGGSASGRLLGGCLSILEAGLGTPWALRVDEPCVLFLEDIGVRPYQWDRMLQHLEAAGMLRQVRGIVLGDMRACVEAAEMELLKAACLHALRGFKGPIAMGLRCGHVESGNRSLLLGSEAELVCEEEATLGFASEV